LTKERRKKEKKGKKRKEKRKKEKARSNRIFNRYFPFLRVNLAESVTESGNNEKILSRSLASSYFLSRGS
jgi:hypothetical protein